MVTVLSTHYWNFEVLSVNDTVSASIIATHKAILCNLEERQLRDTLNNISYQTFDVF